MNDLNEQSPIQQILSQVNNNLDNPEWLSKVAITLSSALYYHNTQMAEAENAEKKKLVYYLENKNAGDKRMSVAEAESRATTDTGNEYGKLKAQGEGVVETINAIKMRIRVLTWERGQGANE